MIKWNSREIFNKKIIYFIKIFSKNKKMDFNQLKQKALELKDKTLKATKDAIDTTAQKINQSSFVIKNQQELDDFILKSENKTYLSKDWETKIFNKRCVIIFWDCESDFIKDFLVYLPILITKAFSQNLNIKIADSSSKEITLSKYELSSFPCMVVFENKEIYKKIYTEEKIKEITKKFTLDINQSIDEI